MSYYRYISGLYSSDLRQLNRTLRSTSVPRTSHTLDTSRYSRSNSVPPSSYYSRSFSSHAATPFNDRAKSLARESDYISTYSDSRRTTNSVPPSSYYSHAFSSHAATPFNDRAKSLERELDYISTYSDSRSTGTYSNFDCKVANYMSKLQTEDTLRSSVAQARNYRSVRENRESLQRERSYSPESFAYRYNYYDGGKHLPDYLYPMSREVLGTWKHSGLSQDTLNLRNSRATSPLRSRELDRYYETKKYSNYIGDISSGGAVDFRHYNYRRVPYFGGSDNYQYMRARRGKLYSKM